ncbi:MAG: FtsW/RodA/SpoVE family cell cycle protein, partial [Verrucomicrobiota bacterium]
MIQTKVIIRRLKRMDWLMLLAILVLLTVGVAFIYSACYRTEDLPVNSIYKKQIVWCVIGLLAYFAFALLDYHRLRELAWPLFWIAVFLLIMVLFVGVEINKARRWFRIFGVLVQPSELAKLATILVVARFLGRQGLDMKDPRNTLKVLIMVAIPFFFIFKEPDLGTAMVLIPVVGVMLFVSGVPMKTLAILCTVGLMLMPIGWFTLKDYQKKRILVVLDPGKDPLRTGWNKIQSEIAVGSGGMTGKGYLKGTQN